MTENAHRLYGVADLLALVVLVVNLVVLVVVTGPAGTALHLLLGLPVLLFAPGYALVAVLYPGTPTPTDGERPRSASVPATGRGDSVGTPARLGLSVVASVAAVAATAAAVDLSPWPIRPLPLLAGVSLLTLAAVAVAWYRRRSLPRHRRYAPEVPWRPVAAAFRPRRSASFLLGIVFLASVVAAGAVVGGYAGTTPASDGDQFTEFSVLAGDGSGALVASNYTERIEDNESLYVYVANSEGTPTEYTVVLIRETVGRDGSGIGVATATERDRTNVTLAPGDSHVVEYTPEPTAAERPQRLRAYLYRGDAPATPSRETAYRTGQVWYTDDPAEALGFGGNATDAP